MRRAEYEQLWNDEEFVIDQRKERLFVACCECGLVHEIKIKVKKDNKLGIIINRDDRKTKSFRRQNGRRQK